MPVKRNFRDGGMCAVGKRRDRVYTQRLLGKHLWKRGLQVAARHVGVEQAEKEAKVVTARVGKEAPDFEAKAFVDGGFKSVKLSDYRGKWVALCFYPGDFTFV